MCQPKPGEPAFTLVGRDQLAAQTVRYWAGLAKLAGVNDAKVADALRIADAMEEYPGQKVPD